MQHTLCDSTLWAYNIKAIFILTFTSWSTLGTPPPYLSRPHPDTVAIFPVNSAPSGGIQIGTEKEEMEKKYLS
jgi:hypothetical protein